MPQNEWEGHDGREIQQVIWDPQNEPNKAGSLVCTPVQQLVLRAEYMGDRTEVWVACIRDGKEVARHNTRHISSIVWV
jgi:hypothetical protein